MKLETYLKEQSISPEAFAVQLGVSKFAVQKWMRGERFPRAEHLIAIDRATDGAVTASDLLVMPEAAQ